MKYRHTLSPGQLAGIGLLCVLLVGLAAHAQSTPSPSAGERLLVIISDLHWGLGKDADGNWDPREDFRWGQALENFLDHVALQGNDKVDLVILGDLLELWQPPESVSCRGSGADLGCTPDEILAIAQAVVTAHEQDFMRLREFAEKGENRIYVVPGNHDAALLLPDVWALVFQKLGAAPDRVMRVSSGIWCSADGRVVVEHGHQIGQDVNRYDDWPRILSESAGQDYLVRPWGEYFVQQIFNDEERRYPIIDNLGPESAGVRYRMAERGMVGTASDMARFVVFNIFQTSLAQKIDVLGASAGNGNVAPESRPDQERRRRERGRAMGHQLFLQTLPAGDPLAELIAADSSESRALREELDRLVVTMQDPEIDALCLQAARTSGRDPCADSDELGMLLERALVSKRSVMRRHLDERLSAYPRAAVFVYGHTHQAEEPWTVDLTDGRVVTVLNSGAFQRLISETGYLARGTDWETPSQGLVELDLEDLPPCYTAVLITQRNARPHPRLSVWHNQEGEGGSPRAPEDPDCR